MPTKTLCIADVIYIVDDDRVSQLQTSGNAAIAKSRIGIKVKNPTADFEINGTVHSTFDFSGVGAPDPTKGSVGSVYHRKDWNDEGYIYYKTPDGWKLLTGIKGDPGEPGAKGDPGPQGDAATVSVGSTTTASPSTPASVVNSGTTSAAVLDFTIPKGDTGTAATVSVGTTTTGSPSTPAAVTNSGTSSAAVFNFTIPKGDTGSPGSPGSAATVAVGTTTTGAAGSSAAVTNSGTSSAAVFNFTIPKGDTGSPGSPGTPGAAATIAVGTTTTGTPSTPASVTNSGTSSAAVFDFVIPKGDTGSPGSPGTAATVAVGTTTTGAAGSSASVTNSGTSSAAVFNFTIPQGATGSAATVAVGTTTTGAAGSSASVTNSGTSSAAVFNFTIPKGDTGATGPAPSGTGLVSVTAGVLDTPSTLSDRVFADAANLRTQLGLGSLATQSSVAYSSLTGIPSSFTPSAHASTHAAAGSDPLTLSQSQITNLTTDLAAKAPIANPVFTGSLGLGSSYFFEDAANVLTQRNGTNPQAFRWYNTYTDASNYERAFARWNSNVFEIGPEAAGTGLQRQMVCALGTATLDTPMSVQQTWNVPLVATTGASGTGTTATITFAAQAQVYPVGSIVCVSGITPTGYNGNYVVTASTLTSVSYANTTTGAQTVAGTVQHFNKGALRVNITDSSSYVAARAFEIAVNGSSKFYVDKSGNLTTSGALILTDTYLTRDGTNNFAQRNGVNPQTYNLYNTYTNSTNYERAKLQWSSNELLFGTENLGTGVARPIKIQTGGTTRAGVTTAGSVYIGDGVNTLATTATDGFLYSPSCAGIPTGVPTTITGTAPVVIDSTNSKLYFYAGGAWQTPGQFGSLLKGSITVNVGALTKTAATNITATITGLTTSHSIIIQPEDTMVYGVWLQGANVTATNTVNLRFLNSTGGNITPGNTVFNYIAWI